MCFPRCRSWKSSRTSYTRASLREAHFTSMTSGLAEGVVLGIKLLGAVGPISFVALKVVVIGFSGDTCLA
jgi:hypothetical protein